LMRMDFACALLDTVACDGVVGKVM
jgi:hypothetical protein